MSIYVDHKKCISLHFGGIRARSFQKIWVHDTHTSPWASYRYLKWILVCMLHNEKTLQSSTTSPPWSTWKTKQDGRASRDFWPISVGLQRKVHRLCCKDIFPCFWESSQTNAKQNSLVVSTHLKNLSQNGNLPQVGVKIKNVWNHLLVIHV